MGDPTVTDLRALKYNSSGTLEYKIKHSEEFRDLPIRLKTNPQYVPTDSLSALYREQRKIKKEKFEHLMFLKKTMEKDYHNFYDSLKHE